MGLLDLFRRKPFTPPPRDNWEQISSAIKTGVLQESSFFHRRCLLTVSGIRSSYIVNQKPSEEILLGISLVMTQLAILSAKGFGYFSSPEEELDFTKVLMEPFNRSATPEQINTLLNRYGVSGTAISLAFYSDIVSHITSIDSSHEICVKLAKRVESVRQERFILRGQCIAASAFGDVERAQTLKEKIAAPQNRGFKRP
jgi:hypothetical protein